MYTYVYIYIYIYIYISLSAIIIVGIITQADALLSLGLTRQYHC